MKVVAEKKGYSDESYKTGVLQFAWTKLDMKRRTLEVNLHVFPTFYVYLLVLIFK